MARWSNFSIWRGRLPHWRADGVHYYVTFRHRRELDEAERGLLFAALLKQQGRKWDIELLCVLPDKTELLATVQGAPTGDAYELSDLVERAKKRAGKEIIKKSGERFPPFYLESYDRIVRDADEMASFSEGIVQGPVSAGLCEESNDYPCLWSNAGPIEGE
ncbi:MAG: hypothetical protein JSS66_17230 [Armatimonadetes bacterium]|nr:hypothetical protein [Armatimonadota bacterium]